MGDWRDVALGEVIELKRGYDLPQKDRSPGKVPLISSSGVTDHHALAMATGPGVVTGRYGTLGKVFYIQEDFWPLNTTLYVRDFKGNDPRFVSYFLRSVDFLAYSDKAAVPGLNRNHLHQARVRLPADVREQRAIAHILGMLDDKIELNRRMNETLEAMARALFKSWFVDFDPVRLRQDSGGQVRAKADDRDPLRAEAAAKVGGLPKPLADLFPYSFEDSEIGEIPKGWAVLRFADTVDIIGGGTPKTSIPEYWNSDVPWFSVVDAPSNSAVWVVDTAKHITREGVENSSTRVLSVGTTIISARGTVGRIALVGTPMAMNQSCYGLRGKAGPHGFFTYFATRELVTSLQQHAHGSVFDTITQDTLAGVSLALPPAALIEAFETRVGPTLERMWANLVGSLTLASLRDTLLRSPRREIGDGGRGVIGYM